MVQPLLPIMSRRPLATLGATPLTGSDSGFPWHDGEFLYADDLNAAFLPLSTGGDVLGRTTVTVNTADLAPNAGASTFLTHLNTSGETPGFSVSGQTNLVINGFTTAANKFNNPGISFWSSTIKNLPVGGLPAGSTQLQDGWAYIGNLIDATNGPSSIGGVMQNEYDMTANHADDGSQRTGVVYVFDTCWPVGAPPAPRPGYGVTPTTGGYPAAFNAAISLYSTPANCVVNVGLAVGLQYSTALWDSRGAAQHGGTIQTTVAAGGTTLHVDNVVGYMQWGGSTTPVSPGWAMPVTIGANQYSVIGAGFDAPVGGVTTTLGTLILASGIIGTDGAAGTRVVQNARTIWLGNGQQLALGGSGLPYLMADTSDGIQIYTPTGVNINAALGVAGSTEIANTLLVLGAATFNSTANAIGGVILGNTAASMGAIGAVLDFNSSGHTTADAYLKTTGGTGASDGRLDVVAAQLVVPQIVFAAFPANAANDAAAASAGVAIGGVYRNVNALQIRLG